MNLESLKAQISKLGPGTLIALATGAGYVGAHSRESSFLGYFGTPKEFVQVTTEKLIESTFSIASFVFTIILILNFIYIFRSSIKGKEDTNSDRKNLKLFLTIFIISALIYTYGFSWAIFIKTILPLLAILTGLVVIAWIGVKAQSKFRNWYKKKDPIAFDKIMAEAASTPEPEDLYQQIGRIAGPIGVSILLFFLVIHILGNLSGIKFARQKTRFNVIVEEKLVLIGRNSDVFIFKEYSEESNSLLPGVLLSPLEEIVGRKFTSLNFGTPPKVIPPDEKVDSKEDGANSTIEPPGSTEPSPKRNEVPGDLAPLDAPTKTDAPTKSDAC
jgi:hypothetical protein